MPCSYHSAGHAEKKFQRRFTRYCLGLLRRITNNRDNEIDYNDRCIRLDLPILNNRLHFLSVVFVVKCLYNKFDIPIGDYRAVNPRLTDSSVTFHHQRARAIAAHHSLFHRFPRLWESLPRCVKDTLVLGSSSFINSLRKHLLMPGSRVTLTETV